MEEPKDGALRHVSGDRELFRRGPVVALRREALYRMLQYFAVDL